MSVTLQEYCKENESKLRMLGRYEIALSYFADNPSISRNIIGPHILKWFVGKTKIFWDFHGTLYPLRGDQENSIIAIERYMGKFYNNKDPLNNDIDKYKDAFRVPPSTIMFLVNSILDRDSQYVLSAVLTNWEADAERKILRQYYPVIPEENYIFVGDMEHKAIAMSVIYDNECNTKSLYKHESQYLMVDDETRVLRSVENFGFSSIHVSLLIP